MKVKGLTEDEAYVLMRSTAMREKKKIGENRAVDPDRVGVAENDHTAGISLHSLVEAYRR